MSKNIPPPDLAPIAKRAGLSLEEAKNFISLVEMSLQPVPKRVQVTEDGKARYFFIERRGLGLIETKSGFFWLYHFIIDDEWKDYLVAVKAELDTETLNPQFKFKERDLLLRIDSGCVTGQVFRDITCDCLQQLEETLSNIGEIEEGLLINIPRQDGRGMGLSFKLATLWIQEHLNADTVEAASLLAPNSVIDERTYSGVIAILKYFDIPSDITIRIATNNPDKTLVFGENDISITEEVPIVIAPTERTVRHLAAKQKMLGHKNLVK